MSFVPAAAKILSIPELRAWREGLSRAFSPVVATNGCFDLLHPGHLQVLEAARSLGVALVVGVTCDLHVRRLKGENRPIFAERDRAMALAALHCVSIVTIFSEPDATAFLAAAAPQIYVKGGDYNLSSINQVERQLLESGGADIRFLSFSPAHSTTGLIHKITGGAS